MQVCMLATIGENRDMVRKRGIGESKDITMREKELETSGRLERKRKRVRILKRKERERERT